MLVLTGYMCCIYIYTKFNFLLYLDTYYCIKFIRLDSYLSYHVLLLSIIVLFLYAKLILYLLYTDLALNPCTHSVGHVNANMFTLVGA